MDFSWLAVAPSSRAPRPHPSFERSLISRSKIFAAATNQNVSMNRYTMEISSYPTEVTIVVDIDVDNTLGVVTNPCQSLNH